MDARLFHGAFPAGSSRATGGCSGKRSGAFTLGRDRDGDRLARGDRRRRTVGLAGGSRDPRSFLKEQIAEIRAVFGFGRHNARSPPYVPASGRSAARGRRRAVLVAEPRPDRPGPQPEHDRFHHGGGARRQPELQQRPHELEPPRHEADPAADAAGRQAAGRLHGDHGLPERLQPDGRGSRAELPQRHRRATAAPVRRVRLQLGRRQRRCLWLSGRPAARATRARPGGPTAAQRQRLRSTQFSPESPPALFWSPSCTMNCRRYARPLTICPAAMRASTFQRTSAP